jgi:hypothetical protein
MFLYTLILECAISKGLCGSTLRIE